MESGVGNLGRLGEDHGEVADRRQVGLTRSQPLAGRRPLELGAVPVAAAVTGDAGIDLKAESVSAEGNRPSMKPKKD